jgi:hypothetical protein
MVTVKWRAMKMPFIYLAAIAMLCVSPFSRADLRTDELNRCLADFGGIAWKLPYQPPIQIRSCASPTVNYDTADKPAPGSRVLQLIGELTLGPGPQLSSDENYAALQHAMLAHFDGLFRRHGFRQVATETGNARVEYPRATWRMLHGQGGARDDEPEPPPGPPIPYVSMARYTRSVDGSEQTLTFAAEAKNTWRITLDGLKAGGK